MQRLLLIQVQSQLQIRGLFIPSTHEAHAEAEAPVSMLTTSTILKSLATLEKFAHGPQNGGAGISRA